MKILNQVLETNDYSKFAILQGNRQVNKLHVKRLKDSFKESYLLSPIIVNQNYEIIDGQHRYYAAKELELPLRFIFCNDYSLKEVQLLNTNSSNWKKEDFLKGYCDLGYPEYLKFRKFMNAYPDFGIASCEAILTDKLTASSGKQNKSSEVKGPTNISGSYTVKYFQNGDLEINDYNKAIENAEKIMMIKPYYDGFFRPVFVRAMLGIFRINYYNHSQLISKLASNPTALQHCSNVTQYKLLIEEIYNFRSRDKVSLRF